MTEKCQIRYRKHSKNKSIDWEFDNKMIEECILMGMKRVEKDSLYGDKIISTHKGLETIFLKRPCNFIIITVYYKTR